MAVKKISVVGMIGQGWYYDMENVTDSSIRQQLKALDVKAGDTIELQVHTVGGSVAEGHKIANTLQETGAILNANILGLCYSEGTYLIGICKNVKMSAHGRLMIHNVKGGNFGTSYDLESTAKDIADYDERLAEVLARKSGKTVDYIKDKYLDGRADKGLTPQEALAEGFIDEVYETMPDLSNQSYGRSLQNFYNMSETEKQNFFSNMKGQGNTNTTSNTGTAQTPQTTQNNGLTSQQLEVIEREKQGYVYQIGVLNGELEQAKKGRDVEVANYSNLLATANQSITDLQNAAQVLKNQIDLLNSRLKKQEVVTEVYGAIAAMRKVNGLQPTVDEIKRITNDFQLMYSVENVSGNFVVKDVAQNLVEGHLWNICQAFAAKNRHDLFGVQKGAGGTNVADNAPLLNTQQTREQAYEEAQKELLEKQFQMKGKSFYQALVQKGFGDMIPLNLKKKYEIN